MTCGEMLVQTGDSRDFTMIFMHGVIDGSNKDYLFDAVRVSEATEIIYEMCVAETNANLLDVSRKRVERVCIGAIWWAQKIWINRITWCLGVRGPGSGQ